MRVEFLGGPLSWGWGGPTDGYRSAVAEEAHPVNGHVDETGRAHPTSHRRGGRGRHWSTWRRHVGVVRRNLEPDRTVEQGHVGGGPR